VKFAFMERFFPHLKKLRAEGREIVLCGDWNIAHREIDLKNWRSLQDYPGFTPAERAWLDSLFTGRGFVDAFRAINQEPHQYTWWSNRGQAWANNTGWRIDYQIVSPALGAAVRSAVSLQAPAVLGPRATDDRLRLGALKRRARAVGRRGRDRRLAEPMTHERQQQQPRDREQRAHDVEVGPTELGGHESARRG